MPSSPKDPQPSDVLEPKKSTKLFVLVALTILVLGSSVGFAVGYYSDRLFTKNVKSDAGGVQAEASSSQDESENKDAAKEHASTNVAGGHEAQSESHGEEDEGKPAADHEMTADNGEHKSSSHVVLDPVITNIATPSDVWLRLEPVFSVSHPISSDVIREIHQDYMAFFRTLRLEDLEGGSPYVDLKSELLARANIRADNAIEAIYFKAFLFE